MIYSKYSIAYALQSIAIWLKKPITKTQDNFMFIALLFVLLLVFVGGVSL